MLLTMVYTIISMLFQRQADNAVRRNLDITDAASLMQIVNQPSSSIKFFQVSNDSVEAMAKEIPDGLQTVPGTMSLHQLTWSQSSAQEIHYRDVSCLCGTTVCSCAHNVFRFSLELDILNSDHVEASPNTGITDSDASAEKSYIGKHVIVKYDDNVYPGVVLDSDETEVKVKCMYKVGFNRFLWPKRDDVIWYKMSDVLAVIPEPTPVTKRHLQVDPSVWENFMKNV